MLKEMLQSCKKKKTIIIEYYGEQKFLSDGTTMAYIGMVAPEWTDEDCAVCLELTEEDREGYSMQYYDKEDAWDGIITDRFITAEKLRFSLNLDGVPVLPFKLKSGEIVFCDMTKLRIFKEEHPKVYYFSKERGPRMYIAVNEVVIGAVAPLRIGYDCMKDFCKELADGVSASERAGLLCDNEQIRLL